MKRLFCSLMALFLLVSVRAQNNDVCEIPFVLLPTGQIIVELTFPNPIGKQLMLFETTGRNAFRKDQTVRLQSLGIDTLASSVNWKKFKTDEEGIRIGDYSFGLPKFRLKRRLSKVGDIAFPAPVLGTIGASFFKKHVVQIDYEAAKLRIAKSIDAFAIPKTAPSIVYRSSFRDASPMLYVHTVEFGEQALYVNTGLPVGICFNWSLVSDELRQRYIDHMNNYELKLDGKERSLVLGYEVAKVYVETNWELAKQEVAFSNDVVPCIGNGFLKHFLVTFDFNRKKLYLEPKSEEAAAIFLTH